MEPSWSFVRNDQLKETVLAGSDGLAVMVNVVLERPPPLFLLCRVMVLFGAVPPMDTLALGAALMVQLEVA